MENKGLEWDYIKCEIRALTRSYDSYRKTENKKHLEQLANRFEILEDKLSSQPSPDMIEEYNCVKQQIDSINLEHTKGIIIRSRTKLIEDDEKSTKYFLNKCKQNYNSKCIQSLITEHGIITKENEILKEEKTFYETLYTKEASNINDTSDSSLLQNLTIPKVSHTQNEQIEQDITLDEIAFALKQLPNNKSPGSHGLPT